VKNFTHDGKTVTLTAPVDILSGDVVVVGSIVGIAAYNAATGLDVDVDRVGVFTLPKTLTDVITQGAKLYYDSGTKKVTITPGTGSKPFIGIAESAAGNGVATVSVILTPTATTGPA